jgi:hypothetical protein
MAGPPDAFLSSEFRQLWPVEVNFNNRWRLAGLRFLQEDGRLTLALKWNCLRPVFGPFWCFAHVLDAGGRQVSSLNHELLDGNPPPAAWRPGDEGYEMRYLHLGDSSQQNQAAAGSHPSPEIYSLRIGLFNPQTNLRLPLAASTLPVAEDFTAAVVAGGTPPGSDCVFRFEPSAVLPCRVSFADAVELVGCSVTMASGIVWVRLRWSLLRAPRTALRFFGHAIPCRDPEVGALAWFDQDMARGLSPRFELDIVRAHPQDGPAPAFLRAGVCTSAGLERLEIRRSTLECDLRNRCFYVPLPIGISRNGSGPFTHPE